MMLRRLKEDVEKNIAPKEETIIEVCLQHHNVFCVLQLCSAVKFLLIALFKFVCGMICEIVLSILASVQCSRGSLLCLSDSGEEIFVMQCNFNYRLN